MALFKGTADWLYEMLEHPEDGPYWWSGKLALRASGVDVLVLHLTGWYDILLDSTIRAYQAVRLNGRAERCRQGRRLVIGPWFHSPTAPYERQIGELDFGPDAILDLNAFRLQWYDH